MCGSIHLRLVWSVLWDQGAKRLGAFGTFLGRFMCGCKYSHESQLINHYKKPPGRPAGAKTKTLKRRRRPRKKNLPASRQNLQWWWWLLSFLSMVVVMAAWRRRRRRRRVEPEGGSVLGSSCCRGGFGESWWCCSGGRRRRRRRGGEEGQWQRVRRSRVMMAHLLPCPAWNSYPLWWLPLLIRWSGCILHHQTVKNCT